MSSNRERYDTKTPVEKKVDDLYKLIEGIEIAIFTTRRALAYYNVKSKPLVLFEVVKRMITGTQPDVSDVRPVSAKDLHRRAGAQRTLRSWNPRSEVIPSFRHDPLSLEPRSRRVAPQSW